MSELKMPENTFGYEHNGSSVIWNVEDIWRAADSLNMLHNNTSFLFITIRSITYSYYIFNNFISSLMLLK